MKLFIKEVQHTAACTTGKYSQTCLKGSPHGKCNKRAMKPCSVHSRPRQWRTFSSMGAKKIPFPGQAGA